MSRTARRTPGLPKLYEDKVDKYQRRYQRTVEKEQRRIDRTIEKYGRRHGSKTR